MYISQMYKYESNNFIYISANVPEGATILETMNILNAEEGYDLVRKSDNENIGSSVWLKNGDSKNNYTEIEVKDEEDS